MKFHHLVISTTLAITTCCAAFAGGANHSAIPKPSGYGYQSNPDPWLISSDLYNWMMNMSGHVTVNHARQTVDQRYGSTLRHIRLGGMIWLSASKGPFSMFFNGLYSDLLFRNYIDGHKIKVKNSFSLITGGLAYRAYRKVIEETGPTINSSFSIIPYIGLRATMTNTIIKAIDTTPTIHEDQHWIQPILGSRFIYQFATNWGITVAGDYGYWGDKSRSINMLSMLSYNNLFGMPILSLHMGYRYMHQYFERDNGKYKWDMDLYGPILGISITI